MNRREFLKAVAAFGAGAALSPLIPAAPARTMEPDAFAMAIKKMYDERLLMRAVPRLVASRLGERAAQSMDRVIMTGFTYE